MKNYYANNRNFILTMFMVLSFTGIGRAQALAFEDSSEEVVYVASSKSEVVQNSYSSTAVSENDSDMAAMKATAIGNQIWMKTNLDVDHYRNGDEIPHVQDPKQWANLTTGAWCYYENDEGNGKVYGKLYNWYAVHDPRGLAPEGWHIPSDEEWNVLIDNLGGQKAAGKVMKANPKLTETESNGFDGLLAGSRNDYMGKFYGLKTSGIWWSSTAVYGAYAWYRGLYFNNNEVNRNYLNKTIGFSVRCVKD